jgi:hypothetical protein
MTWTKVPDELPERLEVAEVGRSARWLLIELTAYANRLQLDGRIPHRRLTRLSDADDVDADLAELVTAGFVSLDQTVIVVPWEDQLTSERVAAMRKQNALRKRRERAHHSGDHSLCDRCAVTRDGRRDSATSSARTDPTRPDPKESGRGQCSIHVGMRLPCVSCAADRKAAD